MPTSINALIVIVLFLMPGFVARSVLSSIYPTSEPSETRLVLTAIALSCANYAIWSWLLILTWRDRWYEHSAFLAALAVLILLLSPVLGTLAAVKISHTDKFRKVRQQFGIRHPSPKAWDYFFARGVACWVIATLKSGRVIGGSFPAAADLYIEKLCNMSPDGRVTSIASLTLGGIIRMEDVQLLEFFEYEPEE